MAFEAQSSTTKTGNGFSLKTGLLDVRVIAINPTLKQLNELGINVQNEPRYVLDKKDGVDNVKIDFWLRNDEHDFTTKLTLFLDSETRKSQAGKLQYINKFGTTAWLMSADERPDNLSWYQFDGIRECYKGEEELHNFLRAWVNPSKESACSLEKTADLFKGNFKELQDLQSVISENTVRVLLGVRRDEEKDKSFQAVYTKYFERSFASPNYEIWNKKLDAPYGEFRATYDPSLKFDDYRGEQSPFDDPTTNVDAGNDVGF